MSEAVSRCVASCRAWKSCHRSGGSASWGEGLGGSAGLEGRAGWGDVAVGGGSALSLLIHSSTSIC